MFRRRSRRTRSSPPPAPAALEPRWQAPVDQARAAHQRFADLARRLPPGPVHDRLATMAGQVEEAVAVVTTIATRAQLASTVARELQPDQATAELKEARRQLAQLGDDHPGGAGDGGVDGGGAGFGAGGDRPAERLRRLADDLAARHQAVHQVLNAIEDAAAELRRLNVRLDAAVAHASALVLRPSDVAGADAVDRELHEVVSELGALRSALDELG